MAFDTSLMRRLGMTSPVIQAPMAGGGDTPALAAAVSEAGGLGFIGGAYSTPDQILQMATAVRARTPRPFGINLFAPLPAPGPADPAKAMAALAGFYEELGLQAPLAPQPPTIAFVDQVQAVLDSGAAAFSFTFGIPPADLLAPLKARGLVVMGTATTVAEARALEAAGVEAVIAQGSEAGGHRGTFLGAAEDSLVGSMALVPQAADAVSIPVVASGGIMDGRGVAAAMVLGAQAVQMGTAFLTCDEAGVVEAYKAAVETGADDQTGLTRAFSGRMARGVVNRVMRTIPPDVILPFPLQNVLTRPMRTEAARQGKADYLSLWAGQGLSLARRGTAAELMARLTREAETALAAVS